METDLLVTVDVRRLVELMDPFNNPPWCGNFPASMVHDAIIDGRLNPVNPCWPDSGQDDMSEMSHAERIAFLVVHGWDDSNPVSVEVGENGEIWLTDGNHRLHALAYMKVSGQIRIQIGGFIDIAEELLDVRIP